MSKHIGIIACSYEGAALCYKTICNEGARYLGEHSHPEVSLHTYTLREYMEHIRMNEWEGVARLMKASAQKLIEIGAQVLICPDNTIHQGYAIATRDIKTKWLHIAETVRESAVEQNYKKLAILGTKYLMEGPVYPDELRKYNIGYEIPDKSQRNKINKIIFDELVYGVVTSESKKYILSVIEELKSEGCDAAVLGCTEIPLIVMPEESPLPTLDSTRIIARAALNASIQNIE